MRYKVTVHGKSFDIDIVERAEGTFVNGEKVALVPRLGPLSVLVRDDRSDALAVAAGTEENVWDVQLAGERVVSCTVEDERARLAKRSLAAAGVHHAGPKTVRAIMPGIILKVAVEPGLVVGLKDPLLVVEAMKMQNEIRAELAGKITKVHVKPGQSVAAGAPLVEITPL